MSQGKKYFISMQTKKRTIRDVFARDAPQCNLREEIYKPKLDGGKGRYKFVNETNYNVALTWAGEHNEVILLLTTFELGMFVGPSNFWRSTNYGHHFEKINDRIHNAYIRSRNGMFKNPISSQKVILISFQEDISSPTSKIYITEDAGERWSDIDIPFQVDGQIPLAFHSTQDNWILARSSAGDGEALWLSREFGKSWIKLKNNVNEFRWGTAAEDEQTVYFTQKLTDGDTLLLNKATNLGSDIKVIAEDVLTFGVEGNFLFASKEINKDTHERLMHTSLDGGITWNEAQLPSISTDRFYSILDMTEGMIFMHVDNPDDTGHGTIYTSDADGIIFSESLERHLYPNGDMSVTDFYKVNSLRGVYLASQIAEDNSIRSMITFDRGGVWQSIPKPAGMTCKETEKDCKLNIHNVYSQTKGINVPMGPLSVPNAVGIIIAHGHVADALQTTPPDVYVTDDGGYTWTKALDGPHHYAITDHGGLIVAVPASTSVADTIKFSYDEGQCWYSYKFADEPVQFTGLLTEPESKSLRVTLWGFGVQDREWTVTVIDFGQVLLSDDSDYNEWMAHEYNEHNGCLLGKKEVFRRLKKTSMCRNGYDYKIRQVTTKCQCTEDDYECDYGYFRQTNSEECKENPKFKGKPLEVCVHGEEEDIITTGYRLIPGDGCEGGFKPSRKLQDENKKCQQTGTDPGSVGSYKDTVLSNDVKHKSGGHAAIAVVVILLLLIGGVAFFVIRKYKFFRKARVVYRYSQLNQIDELNTEIEQLDNGSGPTVQSYHDDSDEDMLE
ncbi:sortilin-like isoform X2 [Glandiceps talaboti]